MRWLSSAPRGLLLGIALVLASCSSGPERTTTTSVTPPAATPVVEALPEVPGLRDDALPEVIAPIAREMPTVRPLPALWRQATTARPLVDGGAIVVVDAAGVARLDPQDGHELWRTAVAANDLASMVASGPLVVVTGFAAGVRSSTALSLDDGVVVWQRAEGDIESAGLGGSGLLSELGEQSQSRLVDARTGIAFGPTFDGIASQRRARDSVEVSLTWSPGAYAITQRDDVAVVLVNDGAHDTWRLDAYATDGAVRWSTPLGRSSMRPWVDEDAIVLAHEGEGGTVVLRASTESGVVTRSLAVPDAGDCTLRVIGARWTVIDGAPSVVWQRCGVVVRVDARTLRVVFRRVVGDALGIIEGERSVERVHVDSTTTTLQWVTAEGALARRASMPFASAAILAAGALARLDEGHATLELSDASHLVLEGGTDAEPLGALTFVRGARVGWIVESDGDVLGTLTPQWIQGEVAGVIVSYDSDTHEVVASSLH